MLTLPLFILLAGSLIAAVCYAIAGEEMPAKR